MKKLIIIIFLLCGCSASTEVFSEINEDYMQELENTLVINEYIKGYNSITENIYNLAVSYKKIYGLDDTAILNKEEFVFDDTNKSDFFEIIKKPLKREDFILYNSYRKLYNSIEPLYNSFENSQSYYNKILDKEEFPELDYLHSKFIINYVNFKNAYYDFKEEFFKYYNEIKYDEVIFLKDMNLNIHSELSKTIIIASDISNNLNNIKTVDDFKNNETLDISIEYLKKQLNILKKYNDKILTDYGFDENEISIIKKIVKNLEEIVGEIDNFMLKCKNDKNLENNDFVINLEQIIVNYDNLTNNLTIIYNDLV